MHYASLLLSLFLFLPLILPWTAFSPFGPLSPRLSQQMFSHALFLLPLSFSHLELLPRYPSQASHWCENPMKSVWLWSLTVFYRSLMINTDALNLLRLNSVSPHQPTDRNTHTNTHIILTRLDCQLANSWETVAMATPDVASEGLAFLPCDTLPLLSDTAQSQRRAFTQIMHEHIIMHP